MPAIHPISRADGTPADHIPRAQTLFRAYGDHLRTLEACHAFDFDRFAAEIADLPRPYTDRNGELLLALSDDPDPTALGCIAFRSAAALYEPHTCEIKRLFVLPASRGQGLAARLVQTALDRAASRGFRQAILDTEPSTMAPALALYRSFGFTEFEPPRSDNPVNVLFLRRDLPPPSS